MYKTIVLPLDGSPESEKSLPEVIRLLQLLNGKRELHVLRVLEFGAGWSSASVIRAQAEEKKAVEEYLDSLSVADVPSDCEVKKVHRVASSPAQAIADYAQEVDADLIVMTCQGRSGLSQFMLGSQTERTLQLAKCSVLVVR